ncbi:MAG: hypothetical protein KDI17_07105 [Halioglobus sp.]|nr:hypothetical protein [Halioglobus sp.]
MNKFVFALLITVMATAANARDTQRFAFLQCGVQLGGKYLSDKPGADKPRRKESRLNRVAGALKAEPDGLTLSPPGTAWPASSAAGSSSSIEFRLPPKITVASIGCSWL